MRIVTDQAWCLTEDGKRVPLRHPLAVSLLVGKGSEIDDAELERYPLLDEPKRREAHAVKPKEKPAPPSPSKKPETKGKQIDGPPKTKSIKKPKGRGR
jgi:hypothetical protein